MTKEATPLPVLGDEQILELAWAVLEAGSKVSDCGFRVRDFYESHLSVREAKIKELEGLFQELVDALGLIGPADEHSGHVCEAIGHSKSLQHEGYDPCPGIRKINAALSSAKDRGYEPKTTT